MTIRGVLFREFYVVYVSTPMIPIIRIHVFDRFFSLYVCGCPLITRVRDLATLVYKNGKGGKTLLPPQNLSTLVAKNCNG